MSKINKHRFKGLSLFASAGIAEFGFNGTDVDILIASELLPKRMNVHKFWHPNKITICGDITEVKIKEKIIHNSRKRVVNFIFATPPCQGVSLIGKNKSNEQMIGII